MDISKLEVGMRIKNYKVLCSLLDEPVKTGGSKSIQMKNIERYMRLTKEKYSFIVEEIYAEPIPKVDGRKNPIRRTTNNRRSFKQFKIPVELENKKGVYKITQGNDIYIGSTFGKKGFRARFRCHLYKNNKTITRNMLLKGGKFESIWMCDDNLEDEYIVREMEEYIINYFKENTTLNVVNNRDKTYITRQTPNTNKNKPDKKEKYSTIKIRAKLEDYARIIQVLNENNIEFTEHKKKGVKNGYKQNKSRYENKKL